MENKEVILSIVFIAIGLFSIGSSILNWDYFFNSRKAQFFLTVFGRTGCRIFYSLIGTALIVSGILMLTGDITMNSRY